VRVNASVPDQTTDDETTSVAERLKNLLKKNKEIIIGGTALVVVTGVLISRSKGQDLTEDTEGFGSFSDPVAEDQKRQSPSRHVVTSHQRRTKNGVITVRPYERGGSTAA
jgi:hypothetical protein